LFRIRRLHEVVPNHRDAFQQVLSILKRVFPAVRESELRSSGAIEQSPEIPSAHLFDRGGRFQGKGEGIRPVVSRAGPSFLLSGLPFHSPAPEGWGNRGALYERVREDALSLNCVGVFFECLPDEPALCKDPES